MKNKWRPCRTFFELHTAVIFSDQAHKGTVNFVKYVIIDILEKYNNFH